MNKIDNPFFHNYVFSAADLDRVPISKWTTPLLVFKTMYCQLTSDGYEARFKIGYQGQIHLFSLRPFKLKAMED